LAQVAWQLSPVLPNYVAPQATLQQALVPAFNYFAAWYLLGVVGFVLVGIETRGRTIERRAGNAHGLERT
jgi:hypothetical protein